jgi:hypothetical protein
MEPLTTRNTRTVSEKDFFRMFGVFALRLGGLAPLR